jgi:Zinc-binding dehydrogenase
VSSEAKVPRAKAAGVDHVVIYTKVKLADEAKRLTDGRGVDVVYDAVGLETYEASLASLRPGACWFFMARPAAWFLRSTCARCCFDIPDKRGPHENADHGLPSAFDKRDVGRDGARKDPDTPWALFKFH